MLSKFFAPLAVKVLAGTSLALLIALAFAIMSAKAGWRDAASWKLAHQSQKAAYESAVKMATDKAIAAKLNAEARYRREAEKTDDDYQTALARAQRASDAYARRMRAQAGRAAGGTSAPADNRGPESPDRSGADAELVAVTRDDFDILVENSVRIEAAHQWAKTLNQPLPSPAFGNQSETRTNP